MYKSSNKIINNSNNLFSFWRIFTYQFLKTYICNMFWFKELWYKSKNK